MIATHKAEVAASRMPHLSYPSGLLQRTCSCGQHTDGEMCDGCAKKHQLEALGQHRGGTRHGLPPAVTEVLDGPGQSLDSQTRTFMEGRFGQDFSQVRIHDGPKAAFSAGILSARAYTTGRDIVFGTGAYAPKTTAGQHLLAHELTHVLQQENAPSLQRKPLFSQTHSADEQQAEAFATSVMAGERVPFSGLRAPMAVIQRSCGETQIGTPGGCDIEPDTFIAGQKLVKFNFDCDTFATGEQAGLVAFAGTIASAGPVTVHGYASTDGDPTYNQNLSCARARAASAELAANGIAAARITTKRHGPTAGPADDRRSATIEAPIAPAPTPIPPTPAPPTPQPLPLIAAFGTVDAASTPASSPDRIPPRVDTPVGVAVIGFTPPMAPVTVSVAGSGGTNGDLTINGAATATVNGPTVLQLRGTTQSAAGSGGNLQLVADQGGTRLAASNKFSVSSVPQNMGITFNCLIGDPGCASILPGNRRGFKVTFSLESDSGVKADLDQVQISEVIEVASSGGSLSTTTAGVTTSGFLPATGGMVDEHSVGAFSSAGFLTLNQTFKYNDARTGAVNIPTTNSGFRIGHFIVPVPGTGVLGFFADFDATTMKFGLAVTSGGIASNAGSGSETRVQRI